MLYKLLIAEAATGIILNSNAQGYSATGEELPYSYFNSLDEAAAFANTLAKDNRELEIIIWNETGDFEQIIAVKPI